MKTVRTQSRYSFITVRSLVLIYLLLCGLTVFFAKTFFIDIFRGGNFPEILTFVIFLTIPAFLLVFLAFSVQSLVRDIFARRMGSRFQARLLGYFAITVLFTVVPVVVITIQSVYEIAQFWRTIRVEEALREAQKMTLENYAFQMEKLENLARDHDFDPLMAQAGEPDAAGEELITRLKNAAGELTAVQDFRLREDGTWQGGAFAGEPAGELKAPPGIQPGFVSREIPRDTDVIRYIVYPEKTTLRVISYGLGEGFDRGITVVEEELSRFSFIRALGSNLKPLLGLYLGAFIFPTLLMTVIITLSFASKITQPLAELTEATRRVAEGDFSIQILARPEDELGVLVQSFNAMVQDLEKSRLALVRTEKISIWQNMAQQLAHEIKNPLTPIKLSAERVLRRWRNEPEKIGEILENSMVAIIQEVEGLSTLLTEFRTLARPMEHSLSWTKLRDLVEETIIPYHTSFPEVQFDIDQVGAEFSVKIDRRHFTQVLTNLIINGIDAMNGTGLLQIRADLVKKRESRYCRLSIRDTGVGIKEEEASQIFTPYFTTKESGTGLGLPIVERIVNDHGGSIWFNSAEGMGTTFFIDLPIDEPVKFPEKGADYDKDPHH
ncbi:MAG: HAMP domain-containing protein [Spirochaetaceae bacterium]|jgi:nitrogen fixation/metabolism regulation signal transduction histidine kinase|nr:HAMP domain-containing protein [Spirochaetaceae bacterium]